jgi:hypothetical protein
MEDVYQVRFDRLNRRHNQLRADHATLKALYVELERDYRELRKLKPVTKRAVNTLK